MKDLRLIGNILIVLGIISIISVYFLGGDWGNPLVYVGIGMYVVGRIVSYKGRQ